MDYMIYKHDQLSLLDMIEADSAQFENWYTGNIEVETAAKHFSVNGEKLNVAKNISSSLLDDLVRLESLHGNVLNSSVHSMECDWLEREEGMNWEPHLLVNPRTGAPVNIGESEVTVESGNMFNENGFTVVPLADQSAKGANDTANNEIKPSKQSIQTYTAFTLTDPQITSNSSVSIQPQLMQAQQSTVQVYLQVTNAVGNIIPSDGTLCLIKMESDEEQSGQTAQAVDSAVMQSGEDSDDTGDGNETYEKPVFSYSCLIAMALKNSETGSLPVNEIYAYILDKFPYFRTAPDGWKNSIRHNLSLNKCFEKIENPTVNGSSRKGCLWGLNPNKADKMDEEIAKWIKRAAKSSMSVTSGGSGVDNNLVLSSNALSANGETHATLPTSTPALVTVCSQSQNVMPTSAVSVVSSSGELNMLEDSLSADPMLAGAVAQSSFWDEETDELMSTAISFGTRRVVSKGTRVHVVPEKDSRQSPLVACRSYQNKISSTPSSDHSNVLTSVAVVASQAAIG